MPAASFEDILDEVFDGKCELVGEHMKSWASLGRAQGINRCQLVLLCYIAWKLEEIERRMAGQP